MFSDCMRWAPKLDVWAMRWSCFNNFVRKSFVEVFQVENISLNNLKQYDHGTVEKRKGDQYVWRSGIIHTQKPTH